MFLQEFVTASLRSTERFLASVARDRPTAIAPYSAESASRVYRLQSCDDRYAERDDDSNCSAWAYELISYFSE